MPAAKTSTFERYGLESEDPLSIEFYCIQQGEAWLKEQGRPILHHYQEAQRLLWPDDDEHRWSKLALETIVNNDITVFMGPGDSNKTYSKSKFVLTDWWADPDRTLWIVSSTELRGAELRIWGMLKQLFNRARQLHPDLPGKVLESMHCITTEEISEDQSEGRLLTKGIIFIPCKRGGTFVGMGAYTGIKPQPGGKLGHAGDEVSAMSRVFLDAYSNWYGKPNFKGVMSGNPYDLDDALCIAAEPIEGWSAWQDTGKTQTWRSKFYDAAVVAFDGRDSPNFDYPRSQPTRYPYLLGHKKMEAVAKTHGKDSWQYFTQCVGKPRPGVAAKRVLTRVACEKWHAFDDVVWLGDPTTKIGSCDAAYGGMGGDRCVTGYIEYGKDITGHMVVTCHEPVIVPVSVNKPGIPENQIAQFCKDYMESVGVLPQNFFFDARGSLAVAFARIWSPLVEAVEFGGKATERPVSNDTYVFDGDTRQKRLQKCCELYSKFVTELWFSVHYCVISDQMRQFPREVCDEFCRRAWDYVSGERMEVETKAEMKERTGESPDLADWLATAIEGARRRGFQIARMPGEGDNYEDDSWKHDLLLKARKERESYTLSR